MITDGADFWAQSAIIICHSPICASSGCLSGSGGIIHRAVVLKTHQMGSNHESLSFTLDACGHVTDRMKQDGVRRMDRCIRQVMGQ